MIVVAGLSHRTAPIEVRERVALAKQDLPALLAELTAEPAIAEAMIISTCNRVEVVAAGPLPVSDFTQVRQDVTNFLVRRASLVERHLYAHAGADAVRHLFRVAASLDSLVVGESQILGQLKEGFEHAREAGTLGPILHRTVPRAIRAAKRVRTETSIGAGQVSVPSVAADLAKQIFGRLESKTVLLVGSGEMAEAVANLLCQSGARLIVLGRSADKVAALARAVRGEPRTWDALQASLNEADVVITSTSSAEPVIRHGMLDAARRFRRGRSSFLIDLAVPRDVEASAGDLEDVFLYNIDDFSRLVAESLHNRHREVERAELIVEAEAASFERRAETEQVTPTILALRRRFAAAMKEELDRSLRGKLKHLGPEDRAAIEKMLEAAQNKLLHAPSVHLREATSDGARVEQLIAALSDLFELDSDWEADTEHESRRPAGDRSRSTMRPVTGTDSR